MYSFFSKNNANSTLSITSLICGFRFTVVVFSYREARTRRVKDNFRRQCFKWFLRFTQYITGSGLQKNMHANIRIEDICQAAYDLQLMPWNVSSSHTDTDSSFIRNHTPTSNKNIMYYFIIIRVAIGRFRHTIDACLQRNELRVVSCRTDYRV